MDDLISRQAAIDEIEYELEMINSALDSITLDFNARERLRQRRGEAREILNSIQQLPSVQSEQQWIPCSERLQEPDERVLVYTVANEYHVWDAMPHRAESYAWEDEEGLCHSLYEVDLWMPLPEPYAERRTDG